jgi:head-tail adaptor
VLLHSRSIAAYRLRARVAEDSRGEIRRSWTDPERVKIPRVADFQRRGSRELVDANGDRDLADARLYLVGAFDLEGDDRVEVDGEVWRIDGKPVARRGLGSSTVTSVALMHAEGVPA